jgi:hypothetical protein
MNFMHDWTLLSILFEWGAGRVTLSFRNSGLEPASLVAASVTELHVPQLNEWGSSVNVYKVIGPSPTEKGLQGLEIQMQSGDLIRIVAASFQLPSP